MQISKKLDDKGTQQSAENVKVPLAPTSTKVPDSAKGSTVESRSFVTEPKLVSKNKKLLSFS